MIEAANFAPVAGVMAGFTRLPGRVRIHVASGASLISEMILPRDWRRASMNMGGVCVVHVHQRLVAIAAQNGRMRVGEEEFGFGMTREIKRRRPE